MLTRDCFESVNKEHRYILKIDWDPSKLRVCFVMLNPSTANKNFDDPTSLKVTKFADRWGYGGLDIVNLFAYRSPQPSALLSFGTSATSITHIIGGRVVNNNWIRESAKKADLIVCGWGRFGELFGRDMEVMRVLTEEVKKPTWCFKLNANSTPKHPLYVPDDAELTAYSFKQLMAAR